MSLRLRRTTCSQILDDDLLELQRQRERELLRPHLIAEKCFPPNKNPNSAAITKDELKKLARAWKLQVWKAQLSTNDMIAALVKFLGQSGYSLHSIANTTASQPLESPKPPSAPRSSRRSGSSARSMMNKSTAGEFIRDFYVSHKIVKNEINCPSDLVTKSRFSQPSDDDGSDRLLLSVRDTWMDSSAQHTGKKLQDKVKKIVHTEDAVSQSKLEKHRTISRHLVLFSVDNGERTINRQSLDAVFRLADTEDKLTLLNCCIVISNFSSRQQLRASLLDMFVMNRVIYFANTLTSSKSRLGISLTLYYLSLEDATQDIIFNSCQSILKGYCAATEQPLSSIALLIMNNLLTCTDRINLVHILMELFQGENGKILQYNIRTGSRETSKDSSRDEIHHMIATLLNMSTFLQCHRILFDTGVFDMIDRLLSLFVARKSKQSEVTVQDLPAYETDTQMIVAMMNTFVNSPEALLRVRNSEYVFGRIFLNLLKLNDNEQMVLDCIHAVAVFSGLPSLVKVVALSDLADAICSYAMEQELSPSTALDLASYICNISKVGLMDAEVLCDKGALVVAIKILTVGPVSAHSAAVSALLNLLTEDANCEEHLDTVMQPLSSLIAMTNNVEAIHCFYNLCCEPTCVSRIASLKGHMWLVQYMRGDCNLECKAAVLRVLVQLCREVSVVQDLLAFGFMNMVLLLAELMDRSLHSDVINFLMCIFLHHIPLEQSDLTMVIYILNKICSGNLADFANDEQLLSKCSIVLGFLSLCDCDFLALERVLRLTLRVAATDLVRESISTALFNIISTTKNKEILLIDSFYLYSMITMMRSGSIAVQEKVIQVIRILCADPRCAEILLQKPQVDAVGSDQSRLVADFIVIALLRTNSADIKVVTAQAIFNLLCHEKHRIDFIKGDVWWAMVRLSKNDIDTLQALVVKLFSNLSTYPEYTKLIRGNSMFSFVKDIVGTSNRTFTISCLQSLQNIIARCSSELTVTEVCSLVQVCDEVLQKSGGIRECKIALQLLHKAAELCTTGQDLNEFIQIDVLLRLEASRSVWLGDVECRRHVAHILALLARFPGYANLVTLSQVEPVMSMLLQKDLESKGVNGLLASLDHEVAQGCMAVIIRYLERDASLVAVVLSLKSWHFMVDSLFHDEDEELDLPMSTRLSALAVFALCVHHNSDTTQSSMKPHAILRTVLSDIDMTVPSTAVNAVVVIQHFALSETLAGVLLEDSSGLFHFLNMTMVKSSKIGQIRYRKNIKSVVDTVVAINRFAVFGHRKPSERDDLTSIAVDAECEGLSIYEFCATVLRNLSHHQSLREKLASSRGLDALFRNILASPLDSVYLDLMITLRNIATCDLSSNNVVSPRFLLMQVTSVLDTASHGDHDPLIMKLAKSILSEVLIKYSRGIGYDARFIQSLLSDMDDNGSAKVTAEEEEEKGNEKDEFVSTLKDLPVKPLCSVGGLVKELQLDSHPLARDAWEVQVQSMESKAMTVNVPFPCGTEQMSSAAICPVDARPNPMYSKISHMFPLIHFDSNEEANPEEVQVVEPLPAPKEPPQTEKGLAKKKISFQH